MTPVTMPGQLAVPAHARRNALQHRSRSESDEAPSTARGQTVSGGADRTRRERAVHERDEAVLAPDHYLYRMLYSQGVDLDARGVGSRSGPSPADPRAAWRVFATADYYFNVIVDLAYRLPKRAYKL